MIDLNKYKIALRPRGERVKQLMKVQKYCLKNRHDESKLPNLFEICCRAECICQKIPIKYLYKRLCKRLCYA